MDSKIESNQFLLTKRKNQSIFSLGVFVRLCLSFKERFFMFTENPVIYEVCDNSETLFDYIIKSY